jgi:hypothetical protein
MFKCKMAVLTIASNVAKVLAKPSIQRKKWIRPPPRTFKVNVGGSFHLDSHAGSLGVVLSDHDVKFIAASCIFLPNIASATVVEVMAMKE